MSQLYIYRSKLVVPLPYHIFQFQILACLHPTYPPDSPSVFLDARCPPPINPLVLQLGKAYQITPSSNKKNSQTTSLGGGDVVQQHGYSSSPKIPGLQLEMSRFKKLRVIREVFYSKMA